MCGISAIISYSNKDITQDLLKSLYHIQHRGKESYEITTINLFNNINTVNNLGLINTEDILSKHTDKVKSCIGLGNVRYTGKTNILDYKPHTHFSSSNENTSVYNNKKFIIYHNGYIKLKPELINSELGIKFSKDINSDTDIILNILIHKLYYGCIDANEITKALRFLEDFIIGSYSIILYISNIGLIVFRDKYGFKPLSVGKKDENYIIISESVGIKGIDYEHICDVGPGEVIIFYDNNNNNDTSISGKSLIVRKQYSEFPILKPCILEWVNIANVSSIIEGISVYESRLKMGEKLGYTIIESLKNIQNENRIYLEDIDYVCPITETSKPSTIIVAEKLGKVYRELIIKNRYVNRTFIMDSQENIKNPIKYNFLMIDHLIKDKNLLIVTDSIVRGNTLTYIISELRKKGANKIIVASCSPPIKYINKYGIDIQDPELLVANGKNDEEIAITLGADLVIYQKIEDLGKSISDLNPDINNFEMSVFDN